MAKSISAEGPLISVVVPCWNVERYVEECVKSLISQKYENIEIILVDDCSTDSTLSILRNLKNKDSRIRIVERKKMKAAVPVEIRVFESLLEIF